VYKKEDEVLVELEAEEMFVAEQKNKNTKRKTDQTCEHGTHGVKSMGRRKLKDVPPAELHRLLGHFFVSVRKKVHCTNQIRCHLFTAALTVTSQKISTRRTASSVTHSLLHLERSLRHPRSF